MFILSCPPNAGASPVSFRLGPVSPCTSSEPEHHFNELVVEATLEQPNSEICISVWPCLRCSALLVTLLRGESGIFDTQLTWQLAPVSTGY